MLNFWSAVGIGSLPYPLCFRRVVPIFHQVRGRRWRPRLDVSGPFSVDFRADRFAISFHACQAFIPCVASSFISFHFWCSVNKQKNLCINPTQYRLFAHAQRVDADPAKALSLFYHHPDTNKSPNWAGNIKRCEVAGRPSEESPRAQSLLTRAESSPSEKGSTPHNGSARGGCCLACGTTHFKSINSSCVP